MKQHKDKADAYILCDLEEVQTNLDESLTNISNIIGSRYVKRLQAEAEDWQDKLNTIFDTLEQWKEVQRNWLYLENIFASSDIRKAKAREYSEFEQINKQWLKLMRQVNTKSSVKASCTK